MSDRFSSHIISTLESQEDDDDEKGSATESDSHADSPVVGKNAAIIRKLGGIF